MAFVNEWVSKEDVKKYDLESIRAKVTGERLLNYVWTVDRERNVFLMRYRVGRDEFSNEIDFLLSWDGVIHTFGLSKYNDRFEGIEDLTTTWRMRWVRYAGGIHSKEEVIDTLKQALGAYKLSAAVAHVDRHTAVFEF